MLYQDSSGESDYSRQALKRVGECNPREAGRLVSLLPRLSQKGTALLIRSQGRSSYGVRRRLLTAMR